MKLPITDEFLWEIFNLSQKVEDALHFLGIYSWREVFVPPNFLIRRIYEKKKAKMRFKKFIKYLAKKGYIKLKALEPTEGIIITKKGLEKIFKVGIKKIKKEKRKDGKYLMVVFDIPETKRALRNMFRKVLQDLGFKFFQKSIWISPFDLLEEVQTIIKNWDLEDYVRIFLIKEIELS